MDNLKSKFPAMEDNHKKDKAKAVEEIKAFYEK